MSGYTTKFNIGDNVWFVETETKSGGSCPCCNGRLESKPIKKACRSTVTDIFINSSSETYNLCKPRHLPASKLYRTKEEAEMHLNDEEKIGNWYD